RYYSADDLVKLKTIKMLKVMSIPLDEIKRLLSMDDLQKVTDTFSRFEKEAQEKIQQLNEGLEYMRRVKGIYEDLVSISEKHDDGYIYKQYFPERKMLIAPPEERLCAANLWRYHDLFYSFLGEQANCFTFSDKAFLFETDKEQLSAECINYNENCKNIVVLPAGEYFCVISNDKNDAFASIQKRAEELGKTISDWHIDEIIITGILKWKYCVQAFILE
ncbi:MAG: hypothetical protein LUD27_08105, partial [Clostridia bacterium]|nr:hypothetical protein [Clostridia bacterium]